MWQEECGPLPIETWLAELNELIGRCAWLSADAADRAVRSAYHLSVLSPLPIRRFFGDAMSESELEDLLERGEADDVAAAIAESAGGICLVRRSGLPRYIATFHVDEEKAATFEAASPALAIIGAWASALTTGQDSWVKNWAAAHRAPLQARS